MKSLYTSALFVHQGTFAVQIAAPFSSLCSEQAVETGAVLWSCQWAIIALHIVKKVALNAEFLVRFIFHNPYPILKYPFFVFLKLKQIVVMSMYS